MTVEASDRSPLFPVNDNEVVREVDVEAATIQQETASKPDDIRNDDQTEKTIENDGAAGESAATLVEDGDKQMKDVSLVDGNANCDEEMKDGDDVDDVVGVVMQSSTTTNELDDKQRENNEQIREKSTPAPAPAKILSDSENRQEQPEESFHYPPIFNTHPSDELFLPQSEQQLLTDTTVNGNQLKGFDEAMFSVAQAISPTAPPLPEDEQEQQKIIAYAKLSFDYGFDFYMKEYNLIIGREGETAAQQQQKRLLEEHQNTFGSNATLAPQPGTGVGSLSPGLAALDTPLLGKKKRSKKSGASSSHVSGSRKGKSSSSSHRANGNLPSTPLISRHQSLIDDPEDEFLTLSHPDGRPLRNISRRHARISYNFDTTQFELEVLGKNGVFVNNHHYRTGHRAPLETGSKIQIGRVEFTFLLPNSVPEDEADQQGSQHPQGGKVGGDHRMSLSFHDEKGIELPPDSFDEDVLESSDISPLGRSDEEDEVDDEDDEEVDEEEDMDEGEEDEEIMEDEDAMRYDTGEDILEQGGSEDDADNDDDEDDDDEEEDYSDERGRRSAQKRGRGRPPKAIKEPKPRQTAEKTKKGKSPAKELARARAKEKERERRARERERQEKEKAAEREKTRRKQAREAEKARILREREEKKQEKKMLALQAREARMKEAKEAKEAKSKEPKAKLPKEKKKKRRSPSPTVQEADLPPHKLLRPVVPYSVMIFDAITNSEHKKLSLPELYRSIEREYPYYKFRAQTHGWQSSVRHNLRGYPDLFYTVEKEGKGYLWGIKEGANVDKERKKRRGNVSPPPPNHHNQPQIPNQPTMSAPPSQQSSQNMVFIQPNTQNPNATWNQGGKNVGQMAQKAPPASMGPPAKPPHVAHQPHTAIHTVASGIAGPATAGQSSTAPQNRPAPVNITQALPQAAQPAAPANPTGPPLDQRVLAALNTFQAALQTQLNNKSPSSGAPPNAAQMQNLMNAINQAKSGSSGNTLAKAFSDALKSVGPGGALSQAARGASTTLTTAAAAVKSVSHIAPPVATPPPALTPSVTRPAAPAFVMPQTGPSTVAKPVQAAAPLPTAAPPKPIVNATAVPPVSKPPSSAPPTRPISLPKPPADLLKQFTTPATPTPVSLPRVPTSATPLGTDDESPQEKLHRMLSNIKGPKQQQVLNMLAAMQKQRAAVGKASSPPAPPAGKVITAPTEGTASNPTQPAVLGKRPGEDITPPQPAKRPAMEPAPK